MTKRKINNPKKGIKGWFLLLLLDLFISGLIMFIFFIKKVILIFTTPAGLGVYISTFLLSFYCIFISITIFKILTKRKSAIRAFILTAIIGAIFLIWYYIVAFWIYYSSNSEQMIYNWINVILNITLTVIMAIYLIKSKRVKNTLIR